jgi:hypothetical protein
MKAFSGVWALMVALLIIGAGLVHAPAAEPGVLLLDDFRLVEGRIERFGGLYRVTAADGTTLLLNDFQVIYSAANRSEAYKFVTERFDPESAADRAKLAVWFLQVADPDRAAAEARAAVELAPTNAQLQELLQTCQREARTARAAKTAAPPQTTTRLLPDRPPIVTPSATTAPAPPPPPPVTAEAANAFGIRIQPILMNCCATCHAHPNYDGPFPLQRIPHGFTNPTATAANLATAAAQLRRDEPAASPLLTMAVTPHGGAKQPPLVNRSHPAFRNLELWVHAAVGRPQTQPHEPARLPQMTTPPRAEQIPTTATDPGSSAPTINSEDPFDPTIFNRRRNTNGG